MDIRSQFYSDTMVEKGRGLRYAKRTFPRVHYEDLWNPYDKCKEIVRQVWSEEKMWRNENAVECFKKGTKKSMAQLLWQSKEELRDRS